jgi:glycosyltransferase involved in cell wall biosynthesis
MRLIAPHGIDECAKGVELISFPWHESRAVRMFLATSMLPLLLRQRADLYHFHDPELLIVGLALKLIYRKKVIYDSREDYPLMMRTKSYIPGCLRSLAGSLLTGLELLAASCLDGIVTADSGTLRRLARTGKSRKRVFFNFPNLEVFPKSSPITPAYDVVYRGGLSERAGTLLLLEAIHTLAKQSKSIRLLLLGYYDNAGSESLVRGHIQALGLQNDVELRGRIAHHEMADVLRQARVGVCPLLAIPKYMRNIPVKVFEYWACGLPVVASDLPPIRPFFREREYGILVKPGDSGQLAHAIGWLLDHPQDAIRMGQRARQAVVERLNNRREVRKLLSFYRRILDHPHDRKAFTSPRYPAA